VFYSLKFILLARVYVRPHYC